MMIGLIRHGQTDWNVLGRIQGQSDIPLNEEGRRQAELLAARLMNEPYTWDFLISSTLSRAEETGKIIASKLNIPVIEPDSRLNERSFGQAEGLTLAERENKWGRDWHSHELGQEKDEEIQSRGLAFMEAMWNSYPDKNMLVITHGGFLAQLYRCLYKDRYTERIGNLSLTILEKTDLEWVPLLYNCTRHLMENKE
ncbi:MULTISPECIES: histidine phosphatase family protein [Paenibacillus]|uniref:Phosphoglycerate mutase n=1 Tax=Paenibacillus azoreducens TaxID=116718 RepID=A0A919YJ04_9BACL|nr:MULTISPECIES: histidine phosphatase family protein [Paenibacillus]MBE9912879.1 histidine phosphatase family protein [Paenibacillus donghaensis]GIO49530.1 phosphoglycerate mutase [Paenibacillus azoreducens]